eukprot:719771-Lingulodinium_polyedra.AAC.1
MPFNANQCYHAIDAMPSIVRRHGGSQVARARAFPANSCSHGVRVCAISEPPWRRTLDSTASFCT